MAKSPDLLEEFINRTNRLRDEAHRAHWAESSGYRHETLGAFYEGLPAQLDKFVEPFIAAQQRKPSAPDNIDARVRAEMLWLAKNREALAERIPALENTIDEVSKFYLDALYKLENLR